MIWGYSFTHSNVHNQLAEPQVYFPPEAAFAHAKPCTEITPSMIPSVSQYAGLQLLTGPQAKAYADHTSSARTSPSCPTGASTRKSAQPRSPTRPTPS